MHQRNSISNSSRCTLVLAMAMVILTACQTASTVDWNSRIGNYTYNQAVADLGPPDKSARLSDGKRVAEWIKHSSSGGVSVGVGAGSYGSRSSVGVGQSMTLPTGHDHVFRLVFGPDDKLTSWSTGY